MAISCVKKFYTYRMACIVVTGVPCPSYYVAMTWPLPPVNVWYIIVWRNGGVAARVVMLLYRGGGVIAYRIAARIVTTYGVSIVTWRQYAANGVMTS